MKYTTTEEWGKLTDRQKFDRLLRAENDRNNAQDTARDLHIKVEAVKATLAEFDGSAALQRQRAIKETSHAQRN